MRMQVSRQRKEILQLQRAGIGTASAEALLQRMLDKVDTLCVERDRLKADLPPQKGKVKALAEVRQLATREGWCYQHVQAITVAMTSMRRRRWATAITSSTNNIALVVAGRITSPDCSRFLRTAQRCALALARAFL